MQSNQSHFRSRRRRRRRAEQQRSAEEEPAEGAVDAPSRPLQWLHRLLPITVWLPQYKLSFAKDDALSGLTTASLLIPQAVAYASLLGVPPQYGLFSAMLPLVVYALLGSSRQLAIGPDSLTPILMRNALVNAGLVPQSAPFIAASIAMAFVVGCMLMGMSLLRLGFVTIFLAHPIIAGFTSAAGVLIMLSQLKHVLGVTVDTDAAYVWQTLYALTGALPDTNGWAVLMAALSIALLVAVKQLNRRAARRFAWYKLKVPGALLIVIVTALLAYLVDFDGLQLVGAVPGALPSPAAPSFADASRLVVACALITLIGFMQSVSIGKSFAQANGYELDANQELAALGAANLVGSFFGAFVVNGGLSRSAVAATAGARTPLYGLVVAAIVVLVTLTLTGALAYVPKAALAAIIIVSASSLVQFGVARELWRVKRVDCALMLLATALTIVLGVELGLLLGVAASLVFVVRRSARPHAAVLGRVARGAWRNVERFPTTARTTPGVVVYRFDASLYFANAELYRDRVLRLKTPTTRAIILDFSAINDVDATALIALRALVDALHKVGVRVAFASVKGPVRSMFVRSGFYRIDDEKLVFARTIDAAIERIEGGAVDAANDDEYNDALIKRV